MTKALIRPHKKIGRKWFDGKDEKIVTAKLEEAAAFDASIEECCFYADISRDSYDRYLHVHPEIRARLAALREKPVLLARQTVVKKLPESYGNAMDYLSRKRKSEFSQRTEDLSVNISMSISPEERVKLDILATKALKQLDA